MLLRAAPPPQSTDRFSWCASLSKRSLASCTNRGRRGAMPWPCNAWRSRAGTFAGETR